MSFVTRVVSYFEALGDLETVLSQLREKGLSRTAELTQTTFDAVLDQVIETGMDLSLDYVSLPATVLSRRSHKTKSGKIIHYQVLAGKKSNVFKVLSKKQKTRK